MKVPERIDHIAIIVRDLEQALYARPYQRSALSLAVDSASAVYGEACACS